MIHLKKIFSRKKVVTFVKQSSHVLYRVILFFSISDEQHTSTTSALQVLGFFELFHRNETPRLSTLGLDIRPIALRVRLGTPVLLRASRHSERSNTGRHPPSVRNSIYEFISAVRRRIRFYCRARNLYFARARPATHIRLIQRLKTSERRTVLFYDPVDRKNS